MKDNFHITYSLSPFSTVHVGNYSDFESISGCTAILFDRPVTATAVCYGNASGTRQFDCFSPTHLVQKINGILFTGGSTFGLGLTGGAMQFLLEKDTGYKVNHITVPIVPTAVIFDLSIGKPQKSLTADSVYKACLDAYKGSEIKQGSIGAGTGATIGKALGYTYRMKGGLGIACLKIHEDILMGALVVVNSFGDILNPRDNSIIAGAQKDGTFLHSYNNICYSSQHLSGQSGEFNTTLAVLITNVQLSKTQLLTIARIASGAFVKAVSPAGLTVDGDVIVAVSTEDYPLSIKDDNFSMELNSLGLLGEQAILYAIDSAVKQAEGIGGVPSWQDIQRS